MKHRILAAAAAALALAACQGEPKTPAGVIPRDRFVAANVAVRALSDSATPQERRAALRKTGVTERQLRAWVNAQVRDPETLSKAWEEIALRVDSISGARPFPDGDAPPSPVTDAGADAHRDSVLAEIQRRRDSLGLPVRPPIELRPGQPPEPGPPPPPGPRPGPRRRPRAIQQ